MSAALPPEVSGLLNQVSELGNGLKNGQPDARQRLMGACSALIAELSHPMESILNLGWAQVCYFLQVPGDDAKLIEVISPHITQLCVSLST
jgi:hypothetical protein